MQRPVLGAVLAGGASRRFGSPKALATVGGVALARRTLVALRAATPAAVVIANDVRLHTGLGAPVHPDDVAGLGAMGGIRTALRLAEEQGRAGALCVACDMPFVPGELLRRIVEEVGDGVDAVVPESTGRRGIEPLCAFYSTRALPALVAMLAAGERRAAGLAERLGAVRLPLDQVRRFGDPETLFLNVNTPDDHRHALDLARAAGERSDAPS